MYLEFKKSPEMIGFLGLFYCLKIYLIKCFDLSVLKCCFDSTIQQKKMLKHTINTDRL